MSARQAREMLLAEGYIDLCTLFALLYRVRSLTQEVLHCVEKYLGPGTFSRRQKPLKKRVLGVKFRFQGSLEGLQPRSKGISGQFQSRFKYIAKRYTKAESWHVKDFLRQPRQISPFSRVISLTSATIFTANNFLVPPNIVCLPASPSRSY